MGKRFNPNFNYSSTSNYDYSKANKIIEDPFDSSQFINNKDWVEGDPYDNTLPMLSDNTPDPSSDTSTYLPVPEGNTWESKYADFENKADKFVKDNLITRFFARTGQKAADVLTMGGALKDNYDMGNDFMVGDNLSQNKVQNSQGDFLTDEKDFNIANAASDLIGMGLGFAERLPGLDFSIGNAMNKTIGKPVENALTNLADNYGVNNKLADYTIQTLKTGTEFGAYEGLSNAIQGKDVGEGIAEGMGSGMLWGAGSKALGEVFSHFVPGIGKVKPIKEEGNNVIIKDEAGNEVPINKAIFDNTSQKIPQSTIDNINSADNIGNYSANELLATRNYNDDIKNSMGNLGFNSDLVNNKNINNELNSRLGAEGGQKYTVVNTAKDKALQDYNDAIEAIHNYFGTNKLTPEEVARIKPELGIDLERLLNSIDTVKTDVGAIGDRQRLSQIAGVDNTAFHTTNDGFGVPYTTKYPNKELPTLINPKKAINEFKSESNINIPMPNKSAEMPSMGEVAATELPLPQNFKVANSNMGLPNINNSIELPMLSTVEKATAASIPVPAGNKLKFDSLAENTAEAAVGWKDKSKLTLKRETLERNLEDIIPDREQAKEVISNYIDPIRTKEAENIRSLNDMRNTVKNFGIKAFSKDSELAQKYGEGLITLNDVKKETSNWENVTKLSNYMRKTYDSLLTNANKALNNNGYATIPKRNGYMPHMGEIDGIMKKLGIDNPELPTDINGLTADFAPGKSFFANALHRKGGQTEYDAVRGFDNYIEGINKIIYHTDNIKRLRSLESSIREKYSDSKHLTNFVSELHEYTNLLAGKKSLIDRGVEDLVGRKVYKIADIIRKQTGANMVGANVSSALTNFIPLTQSMATTNKTAFIKGMFDTISNTFKNDGLVNKSDYLTRRFGSDKLALTKWQKVGQNANWLFKVVDNFVSQTIVRGKYNEGIQKGLSDKEALKQADSWAAKIMADRSLGTTPTLFNAKSIAPLTQFQLEVNNQLSFLFKDLPREYTKSGINPKTLAGMGSALGQVVVYSYIFNNLYEKLAGRRPAFDVIGVIKQAEKDYNNPNLKTKDANKRTIQNITNQLPFVGAVTGGRLPLESAIPNPYNVAIGKSSTKDELSKALFYLLPPTGGGQIKKTIQGLEVINDGGLYNKDKSELKIPVLPTPENKIKAAVLGSSSLPEINKFYDDNTQPLSKKQTEEYKKKVSSGADPIDTYNKFIQDRDITKEKDNLYNIVNGLNINKKDKAKLSKEVNAVIKSNKSYNEKVKAIKDIEGRYKK